MKIISIIILIIPVSACTNSGVIPVGPDTYTISTTSELSPAYAKKSAMSEAVKYCQSQGKEIMPVTTRTGSHMDSFGDNLATFDYTFRCLERGDKQLGRPELKNRAVDINVNNKVSGKVETDTKSDLYTELKKLDQLRKDGILSEKEFQTQKKKILEKY